MHADLTPPPQPIVHATSHPPRSNLPRPLIDIATLASLLAEPSPPIVLDASFDLADPGAGQRAFESAHVPGARYVHLDRDLSGPKTGRNGRHPLPAREAFAAMAGSLGIAPGRAVVVYDRNSAAYAARAWWLLRWLGHHEVAVLDGGLQAWQAAGRAVDAGADNRPREGAAYPLQAAAMPTIDAQALAARIGRWPLIDARGPERFRGDVEPLDPVAGHIPGARNRPFLQNLGSDGRFLEPAWLRDAFQSLAGSAPATEVVLSCGSGVTACNNLLAMEVAGLPGAKLYPGSWSEWCADPARPVAKG